MRLSVLGPVTVQGTKGATQLGSHKQRSILGLLSAHIGDLLTQDQILEAVWGEHVPSGGKRTLAFHISKLRDTIEGIGGDESRIETAGGAYALHLTSDELDSLLFEELADEARLTSGSEEAASLAAQALDLWTGAEPYSDLRYEDFLQVEITRLLDMKLATAELYFKAELERGNPALAIDEIPRLLEHSPYHEGLHGLHMEALVAEGRRVDALRHYDTYVEALADTGNTPQAHLQELAIRLAADDEPAPLLKESNLPASITPFIGRHGDVEQLTNQLRQHRYVDVLGPGGIGKSRLAIEAVRLLAQDEDGTAWLIDLAKPQASVEEAIADVIGLKDRPGESLTAVIARTVDDMAATFVFDNCEAHAEEVAGVARQILQGCPNSRVVATSRFVTDEVNAATFRVQPMTATQGTDDGPELFVARASAAGAVLDGGAREHVIEIVRRLDGVPLAIELAASQLGSRSFDDLFASVREGGALALDETLSVSGKGPLWQMIGSSVDLLDAESKDQLMRISAFSGEFTAHDAAGLIGIEEKRADAGMQHLNRCSLLEARISAGPTTYGLLDTIRQYATEMSADQGIADEIAESHLEWCEELSRTARREILTDSGVVSLIADRLSNIRTAISNFAEVDPDRIARLISRLDLFWVISGRASEGLRHIDGLRESTHLSPSAAAVAEALAGLLASIDRDYLRAETSFARALDLSEHAPQIASIVFANRARSRTAEAFSGRAGDRGRTLEHAHSDFSIALQFFEATNFWPGLATTLPFAAWHSILVGEPGLAKTQCDRTIDIGTTHGYGWATAVALAIRGLLSLSERSAETAIPDLAEARGGFETWGDRYSLQITESLQAAAHLHLGQSETALERAAEALAIMETQGSREWEAMTTGIVLVALQTAGAPAEIRSVCYQWLEEYHPGWAEILDVVGLRPIVENELHDHDLTISQVARTARQALESLIRDESTLPLPTQ